MSIKDFIILCLWYVKNHFNVILAQFSSLSQSRYETESHPLLYAQVLGDVPRPASTLPCMVNLSGSLSLNNKTKNPIRSSNFLRKIEKEEKKKSLKLLEILYLSIEINNHKCWYHSLNSFCFCPIYY